jgi:hypothetical protein
MFLIFSVSETSWLYFFLPWCSITRWLRVVIVCSSSLYLQTFRQIVQFGTINNETTESIRSTMSCILFHLSRTGLSHDWCTAWKVSLCGFHLLCFHIMSSIKVRHQLYLKTTIMLRNFPWVHAQVEMWDIHHIKFGQHIMNKFVLLKPVKLANTQRISVLHGSAV